MSNINYDHYKNVLSFWRDIEYLTFLDAPDKEDKKSKTIVLKDNFETLPWDFSTDTNVKEYFLYIGITPKIDVLEAVKKIFKENSVQYLDNFIDEYVYFSKLTISSKGEYVSGSFFQPHIIHALKCLETQEEFSNIKKYSKEAKENFENRVKKINSIEIKKEIINDAVFADIRQRILEEIEKAQTSITIAVIWFTDIVLFNALLKKINDGVKISVCIYNHEININSGLNYKKIEDNGGVFHFYSHPKLMHNKFVIIDQLTVITGSFNWTNNANNNKENVIITENKEMAIKFLTEFNKLTNNQQYEPPIEKDIEPEQSNKIDAIFLKNELTLLQAYVSHVLPIESIIWCIFEESNPALNSFYIDDIEKIIDKNEKKEGLGNAFEQYIRQNIDDKQRKDLLGKDKNILMELIAPQYLKPSRWPSKIDISLNIAQQAAVNYTLENFKNTDSSLLGINGPPGTGKTTLLKDIIADVIFQKAEIIASLEDPKEAFMKANNFKKNDNFIVHYYTIKHPQLFQKSIVVASNNNAAVENITKELPNKKSIESETLEYFKLFAEQLNQLEGNNLKNKELWGLISGALGNSDNNKKFISVFEGEKGLLKYLAQYIKSSKISKKESEEIDEKIKIIQIELNEHKKNFITLTEKFNYVKSELIFITTNYTNYKKQVSFLQQLNQDFEKIITILKFGGVDVQQLNIIQSVNNNQELIVIRDYELKNKPLFFHKWFKTKKFNLWVNVCKAIEYKMSIQKILDEKKEYEKKREDFEKKYQFENLNVFLNQQEIIEKDNNYFHQLRPFHSIEINKLRNQIFYCSMHLIENFILLNAKEIKANLGLWIEMTNGKNKDYVIKINEANIASLLWNTLFLVVPVISTTLASVGKLFNNLYQQDLAYLLLDEAGQATPQSAAGIIWRAKHSVIIGDPMQIEPVVNISQELVQTIQKKYSIKNHLFSPIESSVQTLADRNNQLGSYIKQDEKLLWNGFPLRTHRRCNSPMFEIANEIAYDNQMVQGKIEENSLLDNSAWYNVINSKPPQEHYIEEEGFFLKNKIETLRKSGYSKEIFVISPFKIVQLKCKALCKNMSGIKFGTVHTFQGKEADVVFFVLGSNPEKSGSRKWATQKPNIFNVAVTRAKLRLYVIGNLTLWAEHRYAKAMIKEGRLEIIKL